MKNNLRRLRAMLNIFGMDAFYSCDIDNRTDVHCQGYYNPKIVDKALNLRFTYQKNKIFINLKRGGYRISLHKKGN